MKFVIPVVDFTKRGWLIVAELIDAYRIIPRMVLFFYGVMVYEVVRWFMLLPEPSTQHTSFVSTVVGLCAIIVAFYNNSGRKW